MFSTKHGSEKKNKNDGSILPYPIYARGNHQSVITRVIHRYTLAFCGSSKPVYKSNTREKTCQVESVEHVEKIVETSHYLKRRRHKAVVDRVVAFAVIICITEQRFCAVFHPYLPIIFFRLTEDNMYTIIMH